MTKGVSNSLEGEEYLSYNTADKSEANINAKAIECSGPDIWFAIDKELDFVLSVDKTPVAQPIPPYAHAISAIKGNS